MQLLAERLRAPFDISVQSHKRGIKTKEHIYPVITIVDVT